MSILSRSRVFIVAALSLGLGISPLLAAQRGPVPHPVERPGEPTERSKDERDREKSKDDLSWIGKHHLEGGSSRILVVPEHVAIDRGIAVALTTEVHNDPNAPQWERHLAERFAPAANGDAAGAARAKAAALDEGETRQLLRELDLRSARSLSEARKMDFYGSWLEAAGSEAVARGVTPPPKESLAGETRAEVNAGRRTLIFEAQTPLPKRHVDDVSGLAPDTPVYVQAGVALTGDISVRSIAKMPKIRRQKLALATVEETAINRYYHDQIRADGTVFRRVTPRPQRVAPYRVRQFNDPQFTDLERKQGLGKPVLVVSKP